MYFNYLFQYTNVDLKGGNPSYEPSYPTICTGKNIYKRKLYMHRLEYLQTKIIINVIRNSNDKIA